LSPQSDDREIAVAPRGNEREMAFDVDRGPVSTLADRKARDLPSVWRGYNGDRILAAGGDDLSQARIIGNSGWTFASGKRKPRHDFARSRIEYRHLIFVFDIDVELPPTIRRTQLK